jgi:cell division protein FtsB
MDNIIEMLKKYAMVIGLVTTLGGGFYAYGVFENRIAQLEKSSGSDAVEKLDARVVELEGQNKVLNKTIEVLNAQMNELKLVVNNPLGG